MTTIICSCQNFASCYITLVLVVKCTHSIASLYIQNVFCYSSDMLFITNLLQNAGFFTKKLKCLKHHQMINYCIERKWISAPPRRRFYIHPLKVWWLTFPETEMLFIILLVMVDACNLYKKRKNQEDDGPSINQRTSRCKSYSFDK